MPVFINEVTAEIPQSPVPQVQSQPVQEMSAITSAEQEFLKTLNLIEERKQRLDFD